MDSQRFNRAPRRSSFSGQIASDRSLSEGTRPRLKKPNVSRDSSTGSSVASLDVRCACQYYKSDALLPSRSAKVGTRPVSFPIGNLNANNVSVPATGKISTNNGGTTTKSVHFR